MSPELFPVDLTPAAQSAATAAVEAAVAAWGERAISELEAEDRLAFACEKAPTEDPVTAQVRSLDTNGFCLCRRFAFCGFVRVLCTVSCAAGCQAI